MRRRLRMSWGEWTALPWHEQRALREGLRTEFGGGTEEPQTEEDELALLRSIGLTVN